MAVAEKQRGEMMFVGVVQVSGRGAHGRHLRRTAPASVVRMMVAGTEVTEAKALHKFHEFFSCMSGTWNSERTYHYFGDKIEVERSQTSFDVKRLDVAEKVKVMEENEKQADDDLLRSCEGFQVSFQTRMERRGFVKSFTNLVFVPEKEEDGVLSGLYMRDYGYEERTPFVAHFSFHSAENKLIMKTMYTKVVSVDSIMLISPSVRVRQILNYDRPPNPDEPLTKVALAGFGMETKSKGSRLVG
eukprot:Plantae.Rhodophyta-Purpureofilum_apyrenoidigerum.ctg6034.p1 GENE.Plantae.Rhodophyta-Purpureofilum_apyrenoidigerum.ctg6034~~Plantae.Rhodophyta-Purpureofilum_apyrenoidigerum.ctg6034.p1  ORF type:complete len:261 (+),score=51.13 Plantae.Rhodophyta-Purpureofilum_apyrenoidigerum.ctg6034:54-785(+)